MKIKTKRGARRIRNQRVITRRFVTTDYTDCPYITAGKNYPFTLYGRCSGDDVKYFRTWCDLGEQLTAKTKNCPHLDGHDWHWGVI